MVAAMEKRGAGMADRSLAIFFAAAYLPSPHEQDFVAHGSMAMRERVIWLEGERTLQQWQRPRRAVRHRSLDERRRTKHEVISVQMLGPLASDALDLGLPQARLDSADHACRDLVLQCEDVVDRAVVALGPDVQ